MADVGILEGDAVRGNPGGMDAVARFLDDTAHAIATIRSQLVSGTLSGDWEGAAAQAFHELLHDVPSDLDKARQSYSDAASAVRGYAARLHEAHDQAQALANRLEQAEAHAAQAQRAHEAAQSSLANAQRAYSASSDPAQEQQLRQTLDNAARAAAQAEGNHSSAQSSLQAIRDEAHRNRQMLDDAARMARGLLHAASEEGIRNSVGSWIAQHGGNFVWHAGSLVVDFATSTLKDAAGVVGAIIDFVADPSWAKLSTFLGHLGAVLAVVALVATVALAIVASGGTAAVILAGVLEYATIGSAVVAGAKLGVDAWRRFGNHEDVSMLDLGADVIDLGLSVVDAKGAFSTIEKFKGAGSTTWKTRYLRYGASGMKGGHGVIKATVDETAKDAVKDYYKESLPDWAAEHGNDFATKHAPVLGDPSLHGRVSDILRSPATQIRRTFALPALKFTPAPAGATP